MQPMLNPKPTDDPHDILVVAPGVAVMVPTDEELSRLARSLRNPPFPQTAAEPELPPTATVPPVDTTFRATATGDVRIPGRPTAAGKAARTFAAALLLAACAGAASISWQSYGDAAEAMIARWTPQRLLALLPLEKAAPAVQPAAPAVETTAANADTVPAGAAPQNTAESAAPAAPAASSDASQTPDPMASQLANARQQIDQLKATIAELKAGQQQMSRDMANAPDVKAPDVTASEVKAPDAKVSPEVRASEARMPEGRSSELRPKMPAHPPRTVAARTRKPMPPPLRQAATAPMLPPPAPYVPRQVAPPPPQTVGETLTDPELAQVPRPPMPVR